MAKHENFKIKSIRDLEMELEKLNVEIPISENIDIFRERVLLGEKAIPNSLAIHPMEGCDSSFSGEPTELTFRRYNRFAESGAGLLWFEACAVEHEGRANPRQLFLNDKNIDVFKRLLNETLKVSSDKFGQDFRPYTVLQLTHSGRYSNPDGKAMPIVGALSKKLDERFAQTPRILSDEELERLEDSFLKSAILAAEVGFDAVDIKSCHGYLISDLLGGHLRQGKYGGGLENRIRFLTNIFDKISNMGINIDLTTRINAYDAVPYPCGWGVEKTDYKRPDLSEVITLIERLVDKKLKMVNVTAGNPYYNPHVNRPFDFGPYTPTEHPLEAVSRLLSFARDIQTTFKDIAVVATGFSWLREFAANVGAGGIEEKWFKIVGFGRQSFAYPDFAQDILEKGKMDRNKCCIACGACSKLMRAGKEAGCPVKDMMIYGPLYKDITM